MNINFDYAKNFKNMSWEERANEYKRLYEAGETTITIQYDFEKMIKEYLVEAVKGIIKEYNKTSIAKLQIKENKKNNRFPYELYLKTKDNHKYLITEFKAIENITDYIHSEEYKRNVENFVNWCNALNYAY